MVVAWRLEHELQRRLRLKIEQELMGRARRGSGDRAGKAAVDRAMQMAAQDALDLPIVRTRAPRKRLGHGRAAGGS